MPQRRIDLGVTGLRRSGKTVFLTSLIYQLLQRGSRGLPAFDARSLELLPAKFASMTGLGKFPYERYVAGLRKETPEWPEPTDTEYQTTLVIPFRDNRPRRTLRFLPQRWVIPWWMIGTAVLTCVLILGLAYRLHLASAAVLSVATVIFLILATLAVVQHRFLATPDETIELHIHDYPGEFLLDVELTEMTFDEWSKATIERMHEQCQTEAARYAHVMSELGAAVGADPEDSLSKLRAAYADYVATAHARHFEMIQPGMALLPWTRKLGSCHASGDPGRNILPFVPVPAEVQVPEQLRHSLQQAYEHYVENDVAHFVSDLSKSSTQVVLVDVLRVLSNGLQCFNDTRRCLEATLTAYQYPGKWFKPRILADKGGHRKTIGQLYRYLGKWFRSRIRRVVFAATKADHALNGDRPHLAGLLATLVDKARGQIGGVLSPRYRWLASLRATLDGVSRKDGRPREFLKGRLVGAEIESVWNPGLVPNEWPDRMIPHTDEPWVAGNDFYRFPRFMPPRFPARDGAEVPHLNLDELLWDILEPCFSHPTKGNTDGRV